jgi:hypothetical protein
MQIQNCTLHDTDTILKLYQQARVLQLSKKMVVWPAFDAQFIENEIGKKLQWKLIINNEIVCNWAIAFEDKEIWEEKEKGDAIYIHRIATDSNFRGNNFVKKIVEWSRVYASENGKKYVRLDTLGNNLKLIEHYKNSGFEFLGMIKLSNTQSLPMHYQKEPNCCLFEIEI